MAAKKPAVAKNAKSAARSTSRPMSRSSKSAGEAEMTIDRRRTGRRSDSGEAAKVAPAAPSIAVPAVALERRAKVQRRRQIDPTTCERDYSVEEVDFMNAMDEYKRTSGRMFPTCSEVLEVIRGMGYVKLSPTERTLLATDHQEKVLSMAFGPGLTLESALMEVHCTS